ncbi:hypothetical protein PybrP1_008019 [[Pythium] brassicae (nom. inval.)]|nr:hypothetical protein PybrP1_008019 [[Pythium] brassicae (nom. inval.)]
MMVTRVLVLGGSSYVAQFVLERLAREKHFTVACTMRGESAWLPPSLVSATLSEQPAASAKGDLAHVYWGVDVGAMVGVRESVRHFRPDVIVNCVAMSSPALCEKDPARTKRINEAGSPRALVDFLEREIDWDLAFDSFLLARHGRVRGLILRIANVLGPQPPLFSTPQAPKFMEWLHQQLFRPRADADSAAAAAVPPVRLWSDEIRSFIYVRDIAELLVELLEQGGAAAAAAATSPRFLLLNVGGVDALSRAQLADAYVAAMQRSESRRAVVAPVVPTSRAAVDLGFHPPLDARLDTQRLQQTLSGRARRTPTASFLDAIYCELCCLDAQ